MTREAPLPSGHVLQVIHADGEFSVVLEDPEGSSPEAKWVVLAGGRVKSRVVTEAAGVLRKALDVLDHGGPM